MTAITPEHTAIVIGGCARSGTSLLTAILSAHPGIAVISMDREIIESGLLLQSPIPEKIYQQISRLVLMSPINTCWCEKTPRNIHNAGEIDRFFGDRLRFIQLVRDGRDVVTSIHPARPDTYWVKPERWISDVTAGLPFEHSPHFFTLKYEDLVTNTREILEHLCRFIGLEFHAHLDRFPAMAKSGECRSFWDGHVTDVYSTSVGRWADPDHQEQVSGLMSKPEAVSLLEHYGYLI